VCSRQPAAVGQCGHAVVEGAGLVLTMKRYNLLQMVWGFYLVTTACNSMPGMLW
jgi:hypothetical protein